MTKDLEIAEPAWLERDPEPIIRTTRFPTLEFWRTQIQGIPAPTDFAALLATIFSSDRREWTAEKHAAADAACCVLLERLGYDAAVQIFDNALKLYD